MGLWGSGQPDSDVKMELDDSGCVQDDSPQMKTVEMENGYIGQANLLDLSDDVLLYILRYCSPHDLKALGYSCARLGALVLDSSLWSSVDSRDICSGRGRARWLMNHALHAGTKELKLKGFAAQQMGCHGHVNQTRQEAADATKNCRGDGDHNTGDEIFSEAEPSRAPPSVRASPLRVGRDGPFTLFRHDMHLPRISSSPCWPESDSEDSEVDHEPTDKCEGPMFTLGRRMLKRLRTQCPQLTTLYLEYCNIDCNKMALSSFPSTLKRLSLKGTVCYNLPLDKSYLFKIQDYLPVLEELELSECQWLEPASLLPLSKLGRLLSLRARHCPAMREFVAYVSLATRYGFRQLEILDLRGSPVGDSEVSALGWLPELRELYLSPPKATDTPPNPHHHYIGDRRRRRPDVQDWETQVPEYYAPVGEQEDITSPNSTQHSDGTSVKFTRNSLNIFEDLERDENGERKRKTENGEIDEEAGPSKRPKDDIEQAISNIQNSKVTITPNSSGVTFRRTIFNNVTDINKRLNSESDDETGSGKQKSSPNNENETQKKDKEESPKKDNKGTTERTETKYPGIVNIRINDGASTSSICFAIHPRKPGTTASQNNPNDEVRCTLAVHGLDTDRSEPPAKKKRVESDEKYQEKLENMSMSSSQSNHSSDNESENTMDVSEPGSEKDSQSTIQAQSSQGSNRSERSEHNTSSCSKGEVSPNKSELSRAGSSRSGSSEVSPSIASRLSRLRRSVGLEASPSNHVGSSPSKDSNRLTIPAPSMEGPSRRVEVSPQYVRFRRNQDPVVIDPVVIQCPARQEEQAEPRHHVLYVNLGQQLHAVYRLLPSRNIPHSRGRCQSVLEEVSSTLVSDSAIRRFGRADGDDVNIVNIGPQFIGRDTSTRPNRSNLRILSATGYRNITNRSLVHLATASPYLEFLDFSETNVTEEGVEQFKSLRPDCQVIFSPFKEPEED